MAKRRPWAHFVGVLALISSGMVVAPKPAAATPAWFDCYIGSIFEFSKDYHDTNTANSYQFNCGNLNQNGFAWMALDLDDPDNTVEKQNRFMAMAQAAILSKRIFRVYHTDATCPGLANCNLVTAWALSGPQP
jgi:hypothetical protein